MTVLDMSLDIENYLSFDTEKTEAHINVIHVRQGDNDITVDVAIYQNGTEYDFTGKYLEFACIKSPSKEHKHHECWVHIKEGLEHIGQTNVWRFHIPAEVTDTDGWIKLAYFVIRKNDDLHYRETTKTFNIYVEKSATFDAHVGYYSDQVTNLLLQAEVLLQAWEDQMAREEEEFQAALKDWGKRYETAEGARNTAFQKAEAERDKIFQAAADLVNAAIDNMNAVDEFYLNTYWKDTPTGFVSTVTFNEFKSNVVSKSDFLEKDPFLRAVFDE